MSLVSKAIAASLAVTACLVAGSVLGQGDDMARAKEEYSRGQELFDDGDYEGAMEAFYESFDAFPHYRTIFNLALCAEKLERIPEAVEFYQRYVDWSEEVPNRGDVLAKIEELRALLPPEPEPEPGTETEPEPEPEPETGEEEPPETDGSKGQVERGPDLRGPGWIAMGTGAAAVVVGGVMLGMARKKSAEMASVDGVPYEPGVHDELPEDGKVYEKAGWAVGGVGIAALASGLVMLLMSENPESAKEPAVEVGVTTGPGGGSATVGVRF